MGPVLCFLINVLSYLFWLYGIFYLCVLISVFSWVLFIHLIRVSWLIKIFSPLRCDVFKALCCFTLTGPVELSNLRLSYFLYHHIRERKKERQGEVRVLNTEDGFSLFYISRQRNYLITFDGWVTKQRLRLISWRTGRWSPWRQRSSCRQTGDWPCRRGSNPTKPVQSAPRLHRRWQGPGDRQSHPTKEGRLEWNY